MLVGVECVEHDAAEAAFQAAERFDFGVALVESLAVVGASEAVETDLCDRDAVQGGIELPVPGAAHPDSAAGVPGPDREGGCGAGVHREARLGPEPIDVRGLPDDLRRGQRGATGGIASRCG